MNILDEVSDVLVESLGVDKDEININSNIVKDLGAESIDFLDIIFRLEKKFNIKIEQSQLFPDDSVFKNPELVDQTGKFTEQGIQYLKENYPFIDIPMIEKNPIAKNISDAYTVDTIVKHLEKKMELQKIS